MPQQKLTVEFTIEQTNLVLAALAKLPFESVADLINSVRLQAEAQLSATPTGAVDAEAPQ